MIQQDFSHQRRMALTWTWLTLLVAIAGAVLALIAGPLFRYQAITLIEAFHVVQYGAWTGIAAAFAGLVGVLVTVLARRWKMIAVAVIALALGLVTFIWPYTIYRTANTTPPIHDISTDTSHPPRFVALAKVRDQTPNGLVYGGNPAGNLAAAEHSALQFFFARPAGQASPRHAAAEKACKHWGPKCLAAVQKAYYPDVQPLKASRVDAAKAFAAALVTAKGMGWKIATADETNHHIEATATSFWFALKYDVAIDITAQGEGSVINMRSESRQNIFDLGDNAKRVKHYLNKLNQSLRESSP
jgi:uncharacterized protein (DUF1499 family)